jgi:TonB family protein
MRTSGEMDTIGSQLAGCWYVDPNLKGAMNLVVDVRVDLLPDGTVNSASILQRERMTFDTTYRDVAESALRAVRKCSPFKLPREKYDTWKTIVFHFNSRGLFQDGH